MPAVDDLSGAASADDSQWLIYQGTGTPHDGLDRLALQYDSEDRVPVTSGRIRYTTFPVIVMTSNGEREFPPAFLRRCLRLKIEKPNPTQLREIVLAHLDSLDSEGEVRVRQFWDSWDRGETHATDQLLNALALMSGPDGEPGRARRSAADRITRPLDQSAA